MRAKKDGVYTVSRRGTKICEGYNKGKCGSKKLQSKCNATATSTTCVLGHTPPPAEGGEARPETSPVRRAH